LLPPACVLWTFKTNESLVFVTGEMVFFYLGAFHFLFLGCFTATHSNPIFNKQLHFDMFGCSLQLFDRKLFELQIEYIVSFLWLGFL
jgi:hypothetical protein